MAAEETAALFHDSCVAERHFRTADETHARRRREAGLQFRKSGGNKKRVSEQPALQIQTASPPCLEDQTSCGKVAIETSKGVERVSWRHE